MTAPISVVIPVLNEAETLPGLLKGLEEQKLIPAEIMFVDAGSTDGSIEIIRNWWGSKNWPEVTCRVISEKGALPGAARNAGIEASAGEWIAFIDAGVIPEPDWLSALFDCAKTHDLKAAFGLCRFIGQGTFERAVCALSYGYGAFRPVLPCLMVHRDVLKDTGPFRPDLRAGEDILWINKLLKTYPRHICRNSVVTYRNFPPSLSRAVKKWYIYGINAVKAGVFKKLQAAYFLFWGIALAALAYDRYIGWSVLLGYVIFRGGLLPMYKSLSWYWWKGNTASFFTAFVIGPAVDLAKTCGFLAGYMKKLKKLGHPLIF